MNQTKNRRLLSAGALCIATLLAACSDKPDALLESARKGVASHDYKTAIIQAKNLLQLSPNLPEARYLLGAALEETGDPVGAEAELRRALALHFPADSVLPYLVRSLLAQGKSNRVIDEFGAVKLGRFSAQADLQLALARAYAMQDRHDNAGAALDAALNSAPASTQVQLAHARELTQRHAYADAQTVLDALISIDPATHEAWKLKGDIYGLEHNHPAEAEAAYRTALAIKPGYADAQAALMHFLLAHNQLEPAAQELEALKKTAPDNPLTFFLAGQLAYQKKDFKTAGELAQRFLRARPDQAIGLELAGAVEMQLEHWPQALTYLSKAVQVEPKMDLARKMLITTYMHEHQPAKALETLQPVLQDKMEDPGLVALAGDVYMQAGDPARAEQYYKLSLQQEPNNARVKTAMALLQMARASGNANLDALQEIAASDKGPEADITLINLLVRQRQFDQALKALEALEKKQPDQPGTAYIRGQVLAAMKDLPGARASLQRALTLSPTYFPAISSLATLDLQEKKPQEARKRYEALLKAEPHNVMALLALAEVASLGGAPNSEVAKLLDNAVAADPARREARLVLVELYLREREEGRALVTAESAAVVLPNDPQVLDALGRSQRAVGQTNQAIATYRKLAELNPQSTMPYMRMVDIQMAAAEKPAAIQSLQKALSIQPDYLDGQRALIALFATDKRWDDALAVARTVQQQRPKQDAGYLLEADILGGSGDRKKALAALQNGIKQTESTLLAAKLHAVLLQSEQGAKAAERFATQWQKDHPGDAGFVYYLGDQALARKDLNGAEQYYVAVLKQQPDNAMALNNLAWVNGQQHKKEAIGLAEKAVALAPNQPSFLDTLAMLRFDKGEYAQALELQNRALQLQPQNTQFMLNLARIALRAGQKDLAKKQLDALSALGEAFPAQDDLLALRKELGKP